MTNTQNLGEVFISKNVFLKMISQIMVENKDLFIDKSYLIQKNDKKAVNVDVNEAKKHVKITLDLNATYAKNINELASKLQEDIKNEIEHMSEYVVDAIDINVVRLAK